MSPRIPPTVPDRAAEEAAVEKLRADLAALIERVARVDGAHGSAIPGLRLIRASRSSQPLLALHEPALCLIVQGRKRLLVGDQVFVYDPARYLVVSVDLPIVGQILDASPERPYLCIRLSLSAAEIGAILIDPGVPASARAADERGLFLGAPTAPFLDAMLRLVRLLESPRDIAVLAPLAKREILYRILQSEQGEILRRIALADGAAQRVAKAIDWLKRNFAERLRIEVIAREVRMSSSALHHQFKAVTAMSPLQFQKRLRLQEARRLMLGDEADAATAAYRVGYESPSQFSREYARLFGAPPARDVARLRERIGDPAASAD